MKCCIVKYHEIATILKNTFSRQGNGANLLCNKCRREIVMSCPTLYVRCKSQAEKPKDEDVSSYRYTVELLGSSEVTLVKFGVLVAHYCHLLRWAV
jgi:hypothetical protein